VGTNEKDVVSLYSSTDVFYFILYSSIDVILYYYFAQIMQFAQYAIKYLFEKRLRILFISIDYKFYVFEKEFLRH